MNSKSKKAKITMGGQHTPSVAKHLKRLKTQQTKQKK